MPKLVLDQTQTRAQELRRPRENHERQQDCEAFWDFKEGPKVRTLQTFFEVAFSLPIKPILTTMLPLPRSTVEGTTGPRLSSANPEKWSLALNKRNPQGMEQARETHKASENVGAKLWRICAVSGSKIPFEAPHKPSPGPHHLLGGGTSRCGCQ